MANIDSEARQCVTSICRHNIDNKRCSTLQNWSHRTMQNDKLRLTLNLICSSTSEAKSGGHHRHRHQHRKYVCQWPNAHVPRPGADSHALFRYRLLPIIVRLNVCVFRLHECCIIWAHQQAFFIVILSFEQTAHVAS